MLVLAQLVLIAVLGLMVLPSLAHAKQVLFFHMYITDGFSYFVKLLLVLGTLLALLLSNSWLKRPENEQFEYPVLVLLSLLGMMLVVSANDLMAFYVGFELMSLPLYVLASLSRDSLKSTEAGLKYFCFGRACFRHAFVLAHRSCMALRALQALKRFSHLYVNHKPANGVMIGLVLIMVGVCFKISAAPFHMWTPDVYEGAPTPVTAFFSIAPKVAALSLFVRLLIQPFGHLMHDWQQVIVVVSVLSMFIGALGALTQSNIKRLLAYSSIGHVGYALVGLAAGGTDGVSGVLIYLVLYVVMSAGAFACVLMMRKDGNPVEEISALSGLSTTRPAMAFCLAVFMFSMAGIPPLAGFFGKMYVFLAAVHSGLNALAVIGVLSSVLACFYYLKVVKIMYFDEPTTTFDTEVPLGIRLVVIFSTLVTAFYCIMPSPLLAQARLAAEALFQ